MSVWRMCFARERSRRGGEMTLQTWVEEFYPEPSTKRMTKKKAIEHSLTKWRGLTDKNLKKHSVKSEYDFGYVADEAFSSLPINESSCALCHKYLKYDLEACEKCPLFKVLGESCDTTDSSPYMVWRNTGNPMPMIKALEKTLEEN
jgi:hypothetical protein